MSSPRSSLWLASDLSRVRSANTRLLLNEIVEGRSALRMREVILQCGEKYSERFQHHWIERIKSG